MGGIEATRRIVAWGPARVVVLTVFDLDDYVYAALQAGASGFLLEDARPDEMLAAIRVAAAGQALIAPSITRRLLTGFARLGAAAQAVPGLGEATVKTHVGGVLAKPQARDRIQAVIAAYDAGLVRPGRGRAPPVPGE